MNRAVLLVAICAAIVGVSYGMHSPIVPVFARDQLAADYSQVGIIGTVNFLPYMFAPFFVGMLLDRLNKSYMLVAGMLLNVFAIFMLSTAQSVPEVMIYRLLAGIAHALFWPSAEVLISTNSPPDKRVKGISTFIAAWILGFMGGPLIGKLVLDAFDFVMLFQIAAIVMAAGIVPSVILRR
ncbi:MAG: MFS transporter, partial [Nitrososphaera sp.]